MVKRVAVELWDGRADTKKAKSLKWYPLPDEGKAMISCKNAHFASIPDHQIDEDGNVSPSLVCPEDGCNWHVVAKLLGWEHYGGRGQPKDLSSST